ncbi:hypothetical protein LOTGIDRAFT_157079 [Lottia gigantea]|uniref:Uncharacterized protein n=1 Tax=Lottia gigantea TaxID=225164 RepID=V4AD83_LOTGI|nr:hypothetical protein LOTGIDRAFT_157079 [Lottia gigantea]ESP01949.1 hypothetical protein LOTGIDRAFT_157079 [Lottia gigantea]
MAHAYLKVHGDICFLDIQYTSLTDMLLKKGKLNTLQCFMDDVQWALDEGLKHKHATDAEVTDRSEVLITTDVTDNDVSNNVEVLRTANATDNGVLKTIDETDFGVLKTADVTNNCEVYINTDFTDNGQLLTTKDVTDNVKVLRNADVTDNGALKTKDVSNNGKVLINTDVSDNGELLKTIYVTDNGALKTKDVSNNGKVLINTDVTGNGEVLINTDVTDNGALKTKDVSNNGKVLINTDVTDNGELLKTIYVTDNGALKTKDVSNNGKVLINTDVTGNGEVLINTDVTDNGALKTKDVPNNGKVLINTDVNDNGQLLKTIYVTDNGALKTKDVSNNGKVLINTDVNDNGQLLKTTYVPDNGELKTTDVNDNEINDNGQLLKTIYVADNGVLKTTDVTDNSALKTTDVSDNYEVQKNTDVIDNCQLLRTAYVPDNSALKTTDINDNDEWKYKDKALSDIVYEIKDNDDLMITNEICTHLNTEMNDISERNETLNDILGIDEIISASEYEEDDEDDDDRNYLSKMLENWTKFEDKISESNAKEDEGLTVNVSLVNRGTQEAEGEKVLDSDWDKEEEIIDVVTDGSEFLRDNKNPNIYIRRVLKSKVKNRVYNSVHCCLFFQKLIQHFRPHLKAKHCHIKKVDNAFSVHAAGNEKPLELLRAQGDDLNNRRVIENGSGELLLFRRPSKNLDASEYGPCPNCYEWISKNNIKRHQIKCMGIDNALGIQSKRNLLLQSDIACGRFKSNASEFLWKEVFSIMTVDLISEIAQNDVLIVALGECWLRQNIDNALKRAHYSSQRMRLAARLLVELRKLVADTGNEKHISMWDFIKPEFFHIMAQAALEVAIPLIDDEDELKSPSNCLKLKYDILRLTNFKWSFVVKEQNDKERKDCKTFLHLMSLEFKASHQIGVHSSNEETIYEKQRYSSTVKY